jgi:hypothetical protein
MELCATFIVVEATMELVQSAGEVAQLTSHMIVEHYAPRTQMIAPQRLVELLLKSFSLLLQLDHQELATSTLEVFLEEWAALPLAWLMMFVQALLSFTQTDRHIWSKIELRVLKPSYQV